MKREVQLTGGRTTRVVRVGRTVRRPVTSRSPFVHELLQALQTHGFTGAPRFLGVDSAGREVLSFVSGTVPAELGHFSDAQLMGAARLLRRFHDATVACSLRGEHEVVCHGDASPCNCVFVDGAPIALIDFDTAHPGSRVEDVAYAAWLWIDIGNDNLAANQQGRRVGDFFRWYGLEADDAVGAIALAQEALAARTAVENVRDWAEQCRTWVEDNRAVFLAGTILRGSPNCDDALSV